MKVSLLLIPLFLALAHTFTVNQLQKICTHAPASRLNAYFPHLQAALKWGNLNNCKRIAAFIAQVAQESGEFRYMEEIASGAAYEGRRDLGNTQKGDGVRFKGRGPIQLTGRNNYAAASKALGVDLIKNPKLAADPKYAFKTAVWFWNSRGLSTHADKNTQAAFDQITLRINGCINCASTHKSVRDSYWRKAKSVLGC